ncbi:hypothetical protein CYLTODRAFT_413406 [Cylindrobasidium torrendii FP15055 ss-10]|uniref:Uncharacterized protein n=1 Tax=Cylindrobasidium torrendii FP15055 ss-10 TaxID=1314674 RepID=A0A0D7B4A3_9AGAR|nr:hypothetical protein CYLTODRAFT_413406 [Cylindrobasidium torrendii FP15055 ss-10]
MGGARRSEEKGIMGCEREGLHDWEQGYVNGRRLMRRQVVRWGRRGSGTSLFGPWQTLLIPVSSCAESARDSRKTCRGSRTDAKEVRVISPMVVVHQGAIGFCRVNAGCPMQMPTIVGRMPYGTSYKETFGNRPEPVVATEAPAVGLMQALTLDLDWIEKTEIIRYES